jgi:hypothetical protein
MPAQYRYTSACALLCRCTQTSKPAAGKSFCVNVIVLFTQCDKTVTVLRRIAVSARAPQSNAAQILRMVGMLQACRSVRFYAISQKAAAGRCG